MAHLENISLEKFRVFHSPFTMDIAPLTFLTGPNSSGKSSIFKSLLLLKSNFNSSLQVLDFSGKDHNLGTFESTINNNVENDGLIYFSLTSNISVNDYLYSTFLKEPVTTKRSVFNILHERNGKDVESVTIKLGYRKLDTSGKLAEISLFQQTDIEPFLHLSIAKDENSIHSLKFNYEAIKKNKVIKTLFFPDIIREDYKIDKIEKLKTYTLKSKFKLLNNSDSQFYDEPFLIFGKLYSQFLKDNIKRKPYKEPHDFILKRPIIRILKDFSTLLEYTEYLEAVRANTKRLYTNDSQGTSFNDLILDFQSRERSNEAMSFLTKWLKRFEIAEDIKFENVEGVATSIYLVNGSKKTALADLGYGVTQFLPILMKISMEQPIQTNKVKDIKIVKKLLLLEEPETNLHPKLQSLLADCLIDAIKTFEVRFIIETHSEYIIRKMQILTAEKAISPSDCLIYYFINPNKVSNTSEQITRIEIKENGMLSDDFGEGFFDEATKMKFELLKLKASN